MCKDPVSKEGHIHRSWGLGCEHIFVEATNQPTTILLAWVHRAPKGILGSRPVPQPCLRPVMYGFAQFHCSECQTLRLRCLGSPGLPEPGPLTASVVPCCATSLLESLPSPQDLPPIPEAFHKKDKNSWGLNVPPWITFLMGAGQRPLSPAWELLVSNPQTRRRYSV